MSLRIHFEPADLARITFTNGPDPLWELLLSLHALQGDAASLKSWRSAVPMTVPVRRLLSLAPPIGYSPDFLTPPESTHGLAAGLTAILRTSRVRLQAELQRLKNPWLRADDTSMHELVVCMKEYYGTAIRPHLPLIIKQIRADRSTHAETLLSAGTGRMLSTLHPALTWRAPVLEVNGPFHRDLRLGGRGLRLVPSYFCEAKPTVLADQRLPPVLVYPVSRTPPAENDTAALAALLGATRAQVLTLTADGPTTSELGTRVDISPASASYHTSILREAGLIQTRRIGTAVRHTLTPLGTELLDRHT